MSTKMKWGIGIAAVVVVAVLVVLVVMMLFPPALLPQESMSTVLVPINQHRVFMVVVVQDQTIPQWQNKPMVQSVQ
jgi:fumarate reductase subunit D